MHAGRITPKPVKLSTGVWDAITTDPPVYIPTPVESLNTIITGLPEGELILIAGRPSQGKTALAMQCVEFAAAGGVPCGVFSMEMSRRSLALRLALGRAKIENNRFRNREKVPLTDDELARLREAYDYLDTLPIYVDDRPGLRSEQMLEAATVWKKEFDVGLIMQDYIQLAEGDGDNRQEIVGKTGRDLKIIARDLSVPVIALSQLNRGIEGRESRKPRMSDLRDSGQLEQTADTIIMFAYPNAPDDDLDDIRAVEMHVVKQRNGPTGVAHAQFNKPATAFETLNEDLMPQAEAEEAKPKGKKEKEPAGKRQDKWKKKQEEAEPT